MAVKEKDFVNLRREYLERKIFLKRQLIQLTQVEIKALEKEVEKGSHFKPPAEAEQCLRV